MLDVARPTAQADLDLPAPDQIGFVVRDLDRAIAQYEPMFGPFAVTDFGPQQASYRGAPPTPISNALRLRPGRRTGDRADRMA